MIIQETVEINGKQYIHSFSDSYFYIQKEETEEVYEEAFDLMGSSFIYVETDRVIPIDEEKALKLTRGDVFRGLLQAKALLRSQIRALIEALPSSTPEEALAKESALIDFDEALYFYRRNPLIDKVGVQLGITSFQMTKFFETNDWHKLVE